MQTVCVLGAGKMGRNIGAYFLARGWNVVWVSSSQQCLRTAEQMAGRTLRRLGATGAAHGAPPTAVFHKYGDAAVPAADVIIESTVEDLTRKRAAFASVRDKAKSSALLLTSTSSILPSDIGDEVIGLHFFYPVELRTCVEIVVPPNAPAPIVASVKQLAAEIGLAGVVEPQSCAFVANRLLLPLQTESLCALTKGFAPAQVDECSNAGLFAMGQLSLMDAIGLDVVASAVKNYLSRMAPDETACLQPLVSGLSQLLTQGKLGQRNHNGFLAGGPLPWATSQRGPQAAAELSDRMRAVFLNTCLCMLDKGEISRAGLDILLTSALQCTGDFGPALAEANGEEMSARLAEWHGATGRVYYKPSPRWKSLTL